MRIYLCGPLDIKMLDHCLKWRQWVVDELATVGCVGIDPCRDGNHPSSEDSGDLTSIPVGSRSLVQRDMRDVRSSDIILCYWPDGAKKRGIGSLMEMALAALWHKPILLVDPGQMISHHPWIVEAVTEFHPNIQSALESIGEYWR